MPQVPRVPKYPSAWVPECPSGLRDLECLSAWVLKCPSALNVWMSKCPSSAQGAQISWVPWMLWVPKCLSTLRVPECLKCSSAWVSSVLKCPWSALLVSNLPLHALRVKMVWNITGNGLVNSFTEFFKNFSKYKYFIVLFALFFLRIKKAVVQKCSAKRCS